jgi:CubicO group peptidase (beta-lactamase class C family)
MRTRPKPALMGASISPPPALRAVLACGLVVVLSAASAAGSATAQDTSPLERMMQLNREGEWEEAARLAVQYLRDGAGRSQAERCQAHAGLAFSRTMLGQKAAATAALKSFDQECRSLPADNWLRGFVARIRRELALPPPAANPMRGSLPPGIRPDDFWQTAAPADLGVDAATLEQHRVLCERTGADACLVVHRGKIVQELYSARYREPMPAMSVTKSVTGILVGMLLDDGKLRSADEPVCNYIPGWCEGRRAKVTIRHLLTMTSGLPEMTTTGVGYAADKNPYVVGLSPASEPGAAWAYSNEGVQLLSPLLDRAAGEPIQDYARRRLFEPLGMRKTRLHLDEQGHAWTYAEMHTTPRELARVGLLMLDKGVWQGKRIVGEGWVEQSTRKSQTLMPRYGLLWWLYDNPRGFAALGNLNTNLYVVPERELIVVRMQREPSNQLPYEQPALRLFRRISG